MHQAVLRIRRCSASQKADQEGAATISILDGSQLALREVERFAQCHTADKSKPGVLTTLSNRGRNEMPQKHKFSNHMENPICCLQLTHMPGELTAAQST